MDGSERTLVNEGKSGRVFTVPGRPDLVEKIARPLGHRFAYRRIQTYSTQTQKRLHRMCSDAMTKSADPFHILRIPALEDPDTPSYLMERVDTSCPIYSEGISAEPELMFELARAWKAFWAVGIAAWDFELYLQSDGTVYLLDFDSFGFRMNDDALPPPSFFENSCFPPHFREMLS